MADAATTNLARLKALQQLRLAESHAELGKRMAELAAADESFQIEAAQLRQDEAARQALFTTDHFNPDELRLVSLVAEGQRDVATKAERIRDEKFKLDGEARQAAATCEAQAEHLTGAHRSANRKWLEKADAKQAAEFLSLAMTRGRQG